VLKSITDLNKSLEDQGFDLDDETLAKSKVSAKDISDEKVEDEDEDVGVEDEEEADAEGEDEDEGEEKDEKDEKKGDKDIKKSFFDKPEIANAVEVSEFLAVVTESMIESLDFMEKSIRSLQNDMLIKSETATSSDELMKSVDVIAKANLAVLSNQRELGDMVKSMGDTIGEISERLEGLEGKPNMRKSVSNINVHQKNFSKSLGQPTDQLSKSQVVTALSNMVQRGDPLVTPQDVISVESGAPMRPELAGVVQAYYAQ
jgi:hypothetical protein